MSGRLIKTNITAGKGLRIYVCRLTDFLAQQPIESATPLTNKYKMLRIFTIVGYLEGFSYLALFFNMLVVKNLNMELYKTLLYPIGMAHGVLFIGYIVLAIILKFKLNWSFKKFTLIFIASLLPFGTFYSEKHWVHRNF